MKMDPKEVEYSSVNWINLDQNRGPLWAFVNKLISIRFSYKGKEYKYFSD
jgi:hypothetical protein